MEPFMGDSYGNPSSIHSSGREAKEAMEKSRRQVAKLINARPRSIIFTAGGSEADNLALKGVAFKHLGRGGHVITSSIEHPAVLNACRSLERAGFRVTYLAVDEYGWLEPDVLRRHITSDTVLVSVMTANNEVGTILPVVELCEIAHGSGALFHTDAVQAVGKIAVDVSESGVDLLSLSGHKIHGPKGIGALYVRKGLELEPLINGGEQEGGMRAGTENVAAAVGLGRACEMAAYALGDWERTVSLRDKLEKGVMDLIPGAYLNGHPEKRLPNTLNMTLPGIRGESIVVAMDQQGIALSSGSACKSGSPEPTHVLLAMGKTEEEAHASVRFSLSRQTAEEEIEITLSALSAVLEEKNRVRLISCK
jgi:cysteine desulfurase NifS